MSKHEGHDRELCHILLKTESLRFGTFKLASGLLSSYYIDLRLIPSDPTAFRRVINFYSSVLNATELKHVRRIAGVPTAGLLYGAVLAYNFEKPFIYVRKETKEHGRSRRVEGLIQPGDKVLIIDDVITTGKNIIDAVDAIKSEGGLVDDAVVLLDRQQNGETNLREIGVRLHSFATMDAIADTLLKNGSIDEVQHKDILSQIMK